MVKGTFLSGGTVNTDTPSQVEPPPQRVVRLRIQVIPQVPEPMLVLAEKLKHRVLLPAM